MSKQCTCSDIKPSPCVQIYVLSRDRVIYLDQTLKSIVNQEYENFEVVVSDNSEQDQVQEMVRRKYPQVTYIRRIPAVSASRHFSMVLSECNKEYTVLFHDDDALMPGYLARLAEELKLHPDVSAVGCDALTILNTTLTGERSMLSFHSPIILEKPEAFLAPYLGLNLIGPAPFPGYMYRTSSIQGLLPDITEGGKYADVSFLLKVLGRGPILWIPDALMQYRIHSGNDSNSQNIGQRLGLLRYIYKTTTLHRKSKLVLEYRYSYWGKWLFSNTIRTNKWESRKYRIIMKFVLLKTLEYSITRPVLWIYLKNRILRRFAARLNQS